MTPRDFQNLSYERIGDAYAMMVQARFGAAYYMAGYAVECALKACIAKLRIFDIPQNMLKQVYIHDFTALIKTAGLEDEHKSTYDNDVDFRTKWDIAKLWSPESRYSSRNQQNATDLIAAVDHPDGVLEWIRQHW